MEPKAERLAKLMVESVYPRILGLLLDIGRTSVTVKLGGTLCDVVFHTTGEIKKMRTDNTVFKECGQFQALDKCPVFQSYSDPEEYIKYCNLMMDKIPVLEKEVIIVDKALERASHIGVIYERKILFEKTLVN